MNSQCQGFESLNKLEPSITSMMKQLHDSREEYLDLNVRSEFLLDQIISEAVDQRAKSATEKQGLFLHNLVYLIIIIIYYFI